MPSNDQASDLERDAQRWRKLLACQRMWVMGSAQRGSYVHFGVSFWSEHPGITEAERQISLDELTRLVDSLPG